MYVCLYLSMYIYLFILALKILYFCFVLISNCFICGLCNKNHIFATYIIIFKLMFTELLTNSHISETCFDWLKTFKYTMEIRSILRAKSVSERRYSDHSRPASVNGERVTLLSSQGCYSIFTVV